jgi:hypothetical protein
VHREIAEPVAVLGPIVVHEADRVEAELRVAQQLLDDDLTGGAGAHDEHPLRRLETPPLLPAAEETNEHPGEGHGARAQTGVDEEHGQRHPVGSDSETRQEACTDQPRDRGRDRARHQDVLHLGYAGEPPEPPVEAHVEQDAELQRDRDRDVDHGGREVRRAPVEPLEAHHVRDQGAEPQQHGIEQEQVTVPEVAWELETHSGFSGSRGRDNHSSHCQIGA